MYDYETEYSEAWDIIIEESALFRDNDDVDGYQSWLHCQETRMTLDGNDGAADAYETAQLGGMDV